MRPKLLIVLIVLLIFIGFCLSYFIFRTRTEGFMLSATDIQKPEPTATPVQRVYVNSVYSGPLLEDEADKADWEAFSAMQQKVNDYLDDHRLVMLLELKGDRDEIWKWNADQQNNGLSSIKIYVMVAIYQQLQEGKLEKTSPVSRYGYYGTVAQALKAMIQQSSNEATGALILKAGGVDAINTIIKKFLGEDMKTHLGHTPGYYEGGYNRVTMAEEVEMLDLIQQGKAVSTSASKEMLDLMLGTEDYFGIKSIAGIESIYHKTAMSSPSQYGIVAKIGHTSSRKYLIAMQIWGKNGINIDKGHLREILKIINTYFE